MLGNEKNVPLETKVIQFFQAVIGQTCNSQLTTKMLVAYSDGPKMGVFLHFLASKRWGGMKVGLFAQKGLGPSPRSTTEHTSILWTIQDKILRCNNLLVLWEILGS